MKAMRKNELISALRKIPGNPHVLVPLHEDQRFFGGACSVELDQSRRHPETRVILIKRLPSIKLPNAHEIRRRKAENNQELDELKRMWGPDYPNGSEK